MSPISITNDSSLHFYLELKRRDSRITAYALRVVVSEITYSTAKDSGSNDARECGMYSHQSIETQLSPIEMFVESPKMNGFISSINISPVDTFYNDVDEMDGVVT